MSSGMTIKTAVERIARLIPTYRSPVLKGDGVWVLTSPAELPPELRTVQEERTRHYMTATDGTGRTMPGHAPRYIVTSYGMLIAWVSLDGRTHFPSGAAIGEGLHAPARWAAIRRHQEAVRGVWPDRFALDEEDGEVSSRHAAG